MASNRFDFNTALHQCAQGNPAALQRIYEHEAPQMMAFGLSLLDSPSKAEELIRETLILSWKNAIGFDAALGNGRAWLYSIFRYRAQSRLQQQAQNTSDHAHSPSLPSANSGTTAFLRNVIRLDSSSRQIILIAYLQGYNYHQIAQRLAMTAAQARVRLRAAIGQLRSSVGDPTNQTTNEQQLLIAEYTLGLLSSTEHQQIQGLLQQDDQAARDALSWEYELLVFADGLRPVRPSDQLLWRIQTALGHETSQPTPTNQQPNSQVASRTSENNTSFIPQLLRADAASSLSIPERVEKNSAVSHQTSSSPLSTSNPINTPNDKSETAPAEQTSVAEPKNTRTASAAKTGITSSLARFLPKNSDVKTPSTQAKTEPSLGATADKESHEEPITPAPINAPITNEVRNPTSSVEPSSTPELKHDTRRSFPSARIGSTLWRSVAFVLALIALGLGAKIALTPTEPPINVIEMAPTQAAVLQAPGQSSSPGWILTVDPEGNILLSPQVETEVLDTQSAQLWTQQASATSPRSLGLIDPNRPVAIPAALIGEVETGQIFEITLENKGGAVSEMPTGPVLFIGRLVRFGDTPAPIVKPVITEAS